MTELDYLKAVRNLIDTGKHEFICAALRDDRVITAEYLAKYLKIVREGLRTERGVYTYTLGMWLSVQYTTGMLCASPERYKQITHLARLAWLDKMIYQLEQPDEI